MVLSPSTASPPPSSSAISKAWVCKKPQKMSPHNPTERCKDCGQKCNNLLLRNMDASLTAIFNQFFYCFKKKRKTTKRD